MPCKARRTSQISEHCQSWNTKWNTIMKQKQHQFGTIKSIINYQRIQIIEWFLPVQNINIVTKVLSMFFSCNFEEGGYASIDSTCLSHPSHFPSSFGVPFQIKSDQLIAEGKLWVHGALQVYTMTVLPSKGSHSSHTLSRCTHYTLL